MKILMLTTVMYPVGNWYRAINLAIALGRRGHDVTIVRGGMQRLLPEVETQDGVKVLKLPRLWGSSFLQSGTRMPWDLAARIAIQVPGRFDVVHAFTHHFNALFPALVGGLLSRSTLTVGDRDDLWTEGGLYAGMRSGVLDRANYLFHSWTEREMGRWFGTMTVVSDDLQERVVAGGIDPTRVRKIINGSAIERITPGDRAAARQALGLPPKRPIALFVGVGQYDIDLVLDAMVLFSREQPADDLPLTVLVGPHGDALLAQAKERGLEGHVIATGMLAESAIVPYLQAADVGLLPFADKPLNWARFPIKLGDYLAAGLPVLTNDVGEIGRLVRETDSGEVTAPNPAAYAAGLARMLRDRAKLAETRARARAAAERYSWDALGESLEAFYVEMGARARS